MPQHQRQQQQQLSFQVTDFRSITKPPPMFFLQPHRGRMAAAIDSSSSHHQQYHDNNNYLPLTVLSTPSSLGQPPLRIDFRVVDPPPRPYSGVWFILQASQTQTKEPYLPQVQKSYLRIKDGGTTVGLLIKYLVYKLKLDGEFETEIRCKGQQLFPFLSLQHVRDNIWNRPRKDVVFINSTAASVDHLMVLHYGRIA
ncbi:protein LAX PANICLE 2-like [Bidens hawaiensis]|uniref:protein LAX PANICLE 2-like n=1 Tax=Bidens hawaiensis TaxID=980011 RepID=UPI00404A96C8